MDILKNDDNFISAINAKVEAIKHSRFTHKMLVKLNYASPNQDNHMINNLIETVFDLVSDEEPLTDSYTLSDGGMNDDGDSGWGCDASIDDIEFQKLALFDSENVYVIYRIKLSNEKSEQF